MPPNDDRPSPPADEPDQPLPEHADNPQEARPDPEILFEHIKEISQTARGNWFALLALLAFVGVTMLAHTDAAFFAVGIATNLPIVDIPVPTVSFFVAAPLLMAALYVHLQLYLVSLWDALGDAPERIGPDFLIDRVHPTMIAQSAVLYRARARRDRSAPDRPFGSAMAMITLLLIWFATPALIAWMFWKSMPLHDPRLTLWIGACLTAAGLFGYEGLRIARGRLSRPKQERDKAQAPWGAGRFLSAGASAALVALLSWETTQGTILTWARTGDPVLLVSADLREAELTPRPSDWKPFELWLRDLRREREVGDPEQDPLIPTVEEMERYKVMIASLQAPNLKERDLREADLSAAFLAGADLRRARMDGANLFLSRMEGVDLRAAQMRGADLHLSQMQGANLFQTQAEGANLSSVRLEGANLGHARMEGVNLRAAQMQGADFSLAELDRADLRRGLLDGAILSGASLQGADLSGAQMLGAILSAAKMEGADLSGAQMEGVDLRLARVGGANCAGTAFVGVLTELAELTCDNISQERLRFAVGDHTTIVPDELFLSSCLDHAAFPLEILERIETAIKNQPEREYDFIMSSFNFDVSREGFRKSYFCAKGEVPLKVGRHLEPRAAD